MLSQTSVLATGRMTNVVSGKRLACCNAEDVHLNTIDFSPVPAPTGANSADLIDRGPLHCKLDKAEENSDTLYLQAANRTKDLKGDFRGPFREADREIRRAFAPPSSKNGSETTWRQLLRLKEGFDDDVVSADTDAHFNAKKEISMSFHFDCERHPQVSRLIHPLEQDKSSRLH